MSMNFGPEWMRKKIPTSYDAGANLSNINNNSMDNYSKGKSVMNDHKVGSNQYKYSKDEVMSIWNNKKKPNNKKMSFDYDKNISSTEPLHPMSSMMPFNNYDKKILGQNSVNTDMASRATRDFNERSDNHFKDRNDNRMNSRPFSYNRGSYDQMTNGRNDFSMDSNKKIGNIWESQNRSNNYMNNNNMYSLKNNKNDINKKPKYKSMSTPLDKDMEMDGAQSGNMDKLNMKDNSNDLSNTFDNMTLKTNYGNEKPLNNSLFDNDIFSSFKSNSLNVAKTQSFDDSMKNTLNKMDNSGLQGNIFSEPDSVKDVSKEINVEPPKWNYKDPTGKIQGPFLYEEMQEWYNAGYFEKTLPIKRENDVEFKSLASMIEQYGEEKPFIIDAENYIQKEKELKASEITSATTAVQPPIASTTTNSKPTIKPIQKTMPSSTHQTTLDTNVTSPINNKTLPMSSYSVGGGIGLGRGIGMKENNSFSNNLDSMYNSFSNNSVNSPKLYSGRNATFPTMGNQYEPVGYPGMNRLSAGMNNPQMMGIPGSQPWVPYNDPSLLGLKGWNDMMGFNDIYNNQFYNYDLMNPDLNKTNFNQHFYYQQLMQQTQQFPPQYYQMMRQMPQNQMPLYNMFGQPINAMGLKPQMVSNSNNLGSMQNEVIPPMNTTTTSNNSQSIFSGSDQTQNTTQNTTNNNMWNSNPQNTINNININTNKAEINKTDSIPNVDNTNTNTNTNKETKETKLANNETIENIKPESATNDIPINEANTVKKADSEEVKESDSEENEEPETELANEETQEENEKEEELVENQEEEEEENDDDDDDDDDDEEEKSEEPVQEEEEKEEVLDEKDSSEANEEVKEEVKKPISPAPAPIKNHWKISTNKTQRLSIKEIQEMEEKEKLEQLKKQQQELKEKKEAAAEAAASVESSPVSHEPTTVWGAPHNNVQKSLRQIMQEEENNKKKQKDLQMKEAESKKASKANVVVNTTRSVWAGRPLTIIADSNSKVVTASSLNAAKKEPVKKEIISSVNRSQPSQVSTSVSNTPTTAKSENDWTPVGKVVKKNESSQKITKSSSKSDNSKKGPSDAFMKWCKNALRVSTSAGVNVDEFINVLLLMPLNETSVIYDICTDTLGGITAIDPLKFAEEFIKRRRMDQNDQSFSALRGYSSYTHEDNKNSNKFIPVKGSGRKKNRQNLN